MFTIDSVQGSSCKQHCFEGEKGKLEIDDKIVVSVRRLLDVLVGAFISYNCLHLQY